MLDFAVYNSFAGNIDFTSPVKAIEIETLVNTKRLILFRLQLLNQKNVLSI